MKSINYYQSVITELKRSTDKNYANKNIEITLLRLEAPLVNGQNSIAFPLVETDNTFAPSQTEKRLGNNEIFIPLELSLQHIVKDLLVEGSELYALENTYIDPLQYVAAPGFTPAHLEVLYKGDLKFVRNNNVLIPQIPTSIFKFVPEQQATGTAQSQRDSESGYITLLNTKFIEGNSQNKITFESKSFKFLSQWQYPIAANKQVRLVLFLRGLKLTDKS